ncbi:uncharacterized protein TNCT_263761 [Trichonephila clavata]|uniref:Uncharacterized protein n=1 Tax=Trichonephila clavata TaxID=2740835 RepID=A0A8X6FS86_TRICU|nr:uncharacterized protein TNCT_263761 [Trichonephila clavata]
MTQSHNRLEVMDSKPSEVWPKTTWGDRPHSKHHIKTNQCTIFGVSRGWFFEEDVSSTESDVRSPTKMAHFYTSSMLPPPPPAPVARPVAIIQSSDLSSVSPSSPPTSPQSSKSNDGLQDDDSHCHPIQGNDAHCHPMQDDDPPCQALQDEDSRCNPLHDDDPRCHPLQNDNDPRCSSPVTDDISDQPLSPPSSSSGIVPMFFFCTSLLHSNIVF